MCSAYLIDNLFIALYVHVYAFIKDVICTHLTDTESEFVYIAIYQKPYRRKNKHRNFTLYITFSRFKITNISIINYINAQYNYSAEETESAAFTVKDTIKKFEIVFCTGTLILIYKVVVERICLLNWG